MVSAAATVWPAAVLQALAHDEHCRVCHQHHEPCQRHLETCRDRGGVDGVDMDKEGLEVAWPSGTDAHEEAELPQGTEHRSQVGKEGPQNSRDHRTKQDQKQREPGTIAPVLQKALLRAPPLCKALAWPW